MCDVVCPTMLDTVLPDKAEAARRSGAGLCGLTGRVER